MESFKLREVIEILIEIECTRVAPPTAEWLREEAICSDHKGLSPLYLCE